LVRDALDAAGVVTVVEIVAAGEPDDAAVLAAAERLGDAGADVVIAIGGGSALDLAKAAALRPDPSELSSYLAGRRVEDAIGIPVVALPTSAGSGAEVSHGAIVLDRAARRKRAIRGPGVAARVAIVDPDLSRSAGAAITAAAGFDALAHAVETAASRVANDGVVDRSARSLDALLRGLPRRIADPDDEQAGIEIARAALEMGVNLAMSTTCLPHRLQYPVGALTGTGHAAGVAAILPAWLQRTADVAPVALAELARRAGLTADIDDRRAAWTLVRTVGDHLAATGMTVTLAELGVRPADLPDLVAAVEGTLANDPGPVGPEDIRLLYLVSLDGSRWTR
jgi:alcohol dehydrogenase class IV